MPAPTMRVSISALLLLICTNAASAQTPHSWRTTVTNPNFVIFLDTASVSRQGDHVTTWELAVYSSPLDIGPTLGVDHSVKRYIYDCRARTTAFDYYIHYAASGSALFSSSLPPDAAPVAPNSAGEIELDAACHGSLGKERFPDTTQAIAAARVWFASHAR